MGMAYPYACESFQLPQGYGLFCETCGHGPERHKEGWRQALAQSRGRYDGVVTSVKALRQQMQDYQHGTIQRTSKRRERIEVEAIHKTLAVVLAELDKVLA